MHFAMTNGSESRTCCPASPVMWASPPTTIAASSKRCSTATAPDSWRDLPERFGDWKNTHKRITRWAKKGVWQCLFEHLATDADNEYAMIDSTIVRAHQHSAGAAQKKMTIKRSAAAKAD
jgi:transposase